MEEPTTIDALEKLISEVKRKCSLKSVVLVHEYNQIVSCKAFRYNDENFIFVASNSALAVKGIVKRIDEYERFKLNVINGILKPEEPYTGVNRKHYMRSYTNFKDGYLLEEADNATLHWKYDDGHLFISDIAFKRSSFFLRDTPCPIEEMGHTIRRLPDSDILKEGEELWFWDNIQILSGRAGEAIVKNGMVKAARITRRS